MLKKGGVKKQSPIESPLLAQGKILKQEKKNATKKREVAEATPGNGQSFTVKVGQEGLAH